jgi:hypothetical protein
MPVFRYWFLLGLVFLKADLQPFYVSDCSLLMYHSLLDCAAGIPGGSSAMVDKMMSLPEPVDEELWARLRDQLLRLEGFKLFFLQKRQDLDHILEPVFQEMDRLLLSFLHGRGVHSMALLRERMEFWERLYARFFWIMAGRGKEESCLALGRFIGCTHRVVWLQLCGFLRDLLSKAGVEVSVVERHNIASLILGRLIGYFGLSDKGMAEQTLPEEGAEAEEASLDVVSDDDFNEAWEDAGEAGPVIEA